jgi:hypothetical protein
MVMYVRTNIVVLIIMILAILFKFNTLCNICIGIYMITCFAELFTVIKKSWQ